MADGGGQDRSLGALREVIVAAALHYRDAMRRYQAEQAAAIAEGRSLEELVTGNWPAYEAAVRAEGQLFALLDSYEEREAGIRGEAHEAERDR